MNNSDNFVILNRCPKCGGTRETQDWFCGNKNCKDEKGQWQKLDRYVKIYL